ncbi:TVG0703424 [Thermoplasma volcanium GSS1]|uniref:TVG0703424 protein n=1 Tax=Thermoplasma volcanium (strain ATCC 51530 / DSM 4299 / JCM 9571 / NBRC 15438 / GSS1) TaxID=273116 RepID=Q97AW1_THEVO|nr:hypothetical protein [Thermoplasma volcanium]BAB59840.1 TVG0703424 [Thermoplasma volcanium GSS1]
MIEIKDAEETYLRVLDHFFSGWIVVSGDHNAIIKLEQIVYMPGTAKNEGLELIMIPPRTLVLAKKTPELRKALKLDNDTKLWDSLVWLILTPEGDTVLADSRHFPADMPEVNRDMFFEELAKELIYGKEGGRIDETME